ncbi:hypothetical protein H6F77_03025 [Microcoleus sp. FACHB-831]|uniref:hypothetical protein n=1 Tax=Microcoleus sp. FACHB-831 TaxID=2692827 RepID=UPI0016871CD5|nr:hypothetical protein [Microcoleus sp. FACHB-831]MBD1920090.1 hypothetical protein [Microcoleus sp. FACHB-831]
MTVRFKDNRQTLEQFKKEIIARCPQCHKYAIIFYKKELKPEIYISVGWYVKIVVILKSLKSTIGNIYQRSSLYQTSACIYGWK